MRRDRKAIAVKRFGGKCLICNYDKCNAALDFHHVDPSKKESVLGQLWTRNWDDINRELQKCILLCCRCHTELHAGFIDAPVSELADDPE